MPNSQDNMQKLLERWNQERGYGDDMTWDGILDDGYWQTSPRILCLLKDTYDDFVYIAPANNGYGPGGTSCFWKNLQSWISVIEQRWNNKTPTKEYIQERCEQPVKSIGYVNIKKRQGNSSVTWPELQKYAKNDATYLQEQIALINPEVILCCGYSERKGSVFDIFSKIIMQDKQHEDKTLANGIHHFGPWMVIDWWHPSMPASAKVPRNWEEMDKLMAAKKVQECILTRFSSAPQSHLPSDTL